MPNCSRSHFSATAPAATRPIVSRAEERPDPTRRAQHSLRQTRRASLTERSQENAAENSKRIAPAAGLSTAGRVEEGTRGLAYTTASMLNTADLELDAPALDGGCAPRACCGAFGVLGTALPWRRLN